MTKLNEQELQFMAIQAMSLYNSKPFKKIFIEITRSDSSRDFYKHCICFITQQNFENEDSHQVDLMVQKIRREQNILTKAVKMTKTEENNYYKTLGNGSIELGKELYKKTIIGRSDDDKDDD